MGGTGGSCPVSGGGGGGGAHGGGGGGGADVAAGGGAGSNLVPSDARASSVTTAPGGTAAAADGELVIVPTGAPTVSLGTVPDTVFQDDVVPTSFTCGDGGFAPVDTCEDADGATATGALHTDRLGTFTYAVTARSAHGLSATAAATYTVVVRPVTSTSTQTPVPAFDLVPCRRRRSRRAW